MPPLPLVKDGNVGGWGAVNTCVVHKTYTCAHTPLGQTWLLNTIPGIPTDHNFCLPGHHTKPATKTTNTPSAHHYGHTRELSMLWLLLTHKCVFSSLTTASSSISSSIAPTYREAAVQPHQSPSGTDPSICISACLSPLDGSPSWTPSWVVSSPPPP